MSGLLKALFVLSLLVNVVAVWGFFHYVRYGGSPLGELKRRLTGSARQDRPAQAAWAQENARIQNEIAAGQDDPVRVVFFGASITARWDLPKYFPELHPINRGVGGQVVSQMLPRFKRDVLDLKPKAAVIKFCSINVRPDISSQTLKDAMSMMCQLARADGIVAVPATIIPAGKPEAHIGDFSVVDSLKGFNGWLRDFAARNGYPLIDYAAAIEDSDGFLPRDCSVDPVHVNDKGYGILAEAARPVLHHVLGLTPARAARP